MSVFKEEVQGLSTGTFSHIEKMRIGGVAQQNILGIAFNNEVGEQMREVFSVLP